MHLAAPHVPLTFWSLPHFYFISDVLLNRSTRTESTRYRDENLTEIRLINTLHLIRIARKGRQKNRQSSRRKPHDPLDLPGDKKFTWWLTWLFLWYALPKNTNREWKRVTI